MNNINIRNIFTNIPPQNNLNMSIKDFSVNTLVESNTFNKSISDDFIINKIKSNKKNEIIKINELYKTKYRECLIKINDAVELNLTDIVFSVGNTYFGYQNYNSSDCIKYIEQKLKEKNFLTLIISSKDLFVSWKNITEI